ncbi:MAG: GspE/PulE family protein [Nitrospira sp.]
MSVTGHSTRGTIADLLGELVAQIGHDQEQERPELTEHDSAIVRLANHLITEADRLGASDIHVEPYSASRDTAVRFRIDGTCFTYMCIPAGYRRAIVSRIKIMANLDIAERRKPQDGKIRYRLTRSREIELRVATLPTAGGNEDVTLRLLTAKEPIPLNAMEFAPKVLEQVQQLADRPQGIFLCVGPTGSGKTTTLHAVLRHINTEERKIVTAEDPIELTQEGLRQVQIHPKIGFTFAAAMRAFLRSDPDVIMIGEMRDKETADIAIEASLTGHLVLSTLHTNSAVETIIRLLDLGCDAFNFSDAMLGVLAQRLCKRLCPSCKEPYHPARREYDELAHAYGMGEWERLGVAYSSDLIFYRGRGCERCNQTGFKGRMALHELLIGSEKMTQRIQAHARAAELLTVAKQEGMATMFQHGVQKILQGQTSLQQVRKVVTG